MSAITSDHESESFDFFPAHGAATDSAPPPSKRQRLNRYHCSACKKHFTERRSLVRHEQTLEHLNRLNFRPNARFPCTSCGQCFTRDFDRRRHENRRHGPDVLVGVGSKPVVPNHNPENATADPEYLMFDEQDLDFNRYVLVATQTGDSDTGEPLGPSAAVKEVIAPKTIPSVNQTAKSLDAWRPYEYQPSSTKESLILKNGTLRRVGRSEQHTCSVCKRPFEEDDDELHRHLRSHMDEFSELGGGHYCHICDVGFAHLADWQMHQRSVANGNCGYNFQHTAPCTGHHPCRPDGSVQPDWDSFALCVMIRHWEQAQVQAARLSIPDVAVACQPKASVARSIDVLYCRRTARSIYSVAISMKTTATAPCDVDARNNMDVYGLQGRLRKMSVKPTTKPNRLKSQKYSESNLDCSKHSSIGTVMGSAEARDGRERKPDTTNADLDGLWRFIVRDAGPPLKTLLENGANPNECHDIYITPLFEAARRKKLDAMDVLLAHRADANPRGGKHGNLLNSMVHENNVQAVMLLLRYDADCNARAGELGYALCYAVTGCITQDTKTICELLLEAGADINARGPQGTPLHFIAQAEYSDYSSKCDSYITDLAAYLRVFGARDMAPPLEEPPISV